MIKTNLNSLARILRVYSSGLIAAVAFVTIFTAKAAAATPQNLDVKVSVNVSKDLTVSGTYYHFGLLAPNVSSNSATAITITNASGGLIETYTLQGSDAVSEGVGTAWTLAAAVATDTYVLQGQFSSARPANADGNWANDTFTTSAVACSDTQFGNGAPE